MRLDTRYISCMNHEIGYAPLQLYGARDWIRVIAALWQMRLDMPHCSSVAIRLDLRQRSSIAEEDGDALLQLYCKKTGSTPLHIYDVITCGEHLVVFGCMRKRLFWRLRFASRTAQLGFGATRRCSHVETLTRRSSTK